MGKKYSPTLIGGFVLGGLVLLVGALFLFGSGDLFKEKRKWVTYFEGSVGGLQAGAPVTFRGVRVGSVTDIRLQLDTKSLTAEIPVYFEIEPDRIQWLNGKLSQSANMAAEAGLRARLGMQSFVTGQMQVELDLLPDTPARQVGLDPHVPEIPSVQSDIDIFKRQLAELPLEQTLNSIDKAVTSIDRLASSPEMHESMRSLAESLGETQRFVASLNERSQPLIDELTATARSARQASDQASSTLKSMQDDVHATLGDVRQVARTDLRAALRSADQALQQARTTLASLDGIVGSDTNARADIETTLQNLAQATSALRSFADTVERKPNSIIVGR